MAKFTRAEVRKILGDAHTDEIENQLFALYLSVVDPMKDDLARYKADAEKLPEVQKELDEIKGGTDWKAEAEKAQKALSDYKAEIAGKEQTAKIRAAYKARLEANNINPGLHDLILRGADMSALKLNAAGELDNVADVDAQIKKDYAAHIVTTRKDGADVDTPPDKDKDTFTNMNLADKMRYANEHPNDASVRAWLKN